MCYSFAEEGIGMNSDKFANGLTASTLEGKWKSNFQWEERNPFNNRMRRSLSWLARAEQEACDPDAAFIFYWIAFNAIYGEHRLEAYEGEQGIFEDYFTKIAPLDAASVVYNAIWMKFNGPIKALLNNQYVFKPFWTAAANWKRRFDESRSEIERELLSRNTKAILVRMFDRLYVLRNQLLHGGATWQGPVNRDQVEDGAAIMAFLVPHFINLMLDNPDVDWGQPHYSPEWAWRQ